MKFKSKVDVLALIGYIVTIGIGGFSLFVAVYYQAKSGFLLTVVCMVIGMLLIMYSFNSLFNTTYTFQETTLYIHSGFFKKIIPYALVMNIKESKKYFTYNCLSIDKLEISYRDAQNTLKAYVSPKDKEEFIKQMRFHCKSAKIERK